MKPEYQFKVEGLTNKEKVLSGLMDSGYIVSCKERVGGWDISVYGKERVDGKGLKTSEWFEKNTSPAITTTPYHPSTIAYFSAPGFSSDGITTTVMNCNVTGKASMETEEEKIKNIETIVKAIENNYGC